MHFYNPSIQVFAPITEVIPVSTQMCFGFLDIAFLEVKSKQGIAKRGYFFRILYHGKQRKIAENC